MVLTVLCHPFTEQKGFTDQYNASCSCCTKDDRILIGSLYGSINVIDLRTSTYSVIHKFPSIGIPVKMLFCDNQQFLLSMESKLQDYRPGLSAREMNCHARIYVNIMLGNPQKIVTPLNSGYTTNRNSNIFQTKNKFAIIDLSGLRQPATDIALCSVRGNIAISSSKKIYLYSYKEVISEDLPRDDAVATIDFIRMIEIQTTISIRSVALVLNWVSFASKTEIRAIQFDLHQPPDQKVYQGEDVSEFLDESLQVEADSKSLPIAIPVQNEVTLWNFDQATSMSPVNEFESKTEDGMIQMQSITEETHYIDSRKNAMEIVGEHAFIVGQPLCCSFLGQMPSEKGHLYYANVTSNTHLYRRFEEDDISFSGNTEKIHSLQWIPIFLEDIQDNGRLEQMESGKTSWPWNSFQQSIYSPMSLEIMLFFSTGTHGYLYNMYKSDGLILTYNYTSDCISAAHSNSLLYTITTNGMEIFTSRLYPFIAEKAKEQIKEFKFIKKEQDKTKIVSKIRQQYRGRDRGETEAFLNANYFTDYVAVSKDLSMADAESFHARRRAESSFYDKYPFTVLSMPCPSKSLEPCLIGMYPYKDVVSVTTTSSFVVMFIKPPKRNRDKASPPISPQSSPWSLNSFEKHSAIEFSGNIYSLIEGLEFSNPTVYYQLLCESHLLLFCDLVNRPLDENLMRLVKKSAADIATFLSRCETSIDDFHLIKSYFETAGLSLLAVLLHLKELNKNLEKKKHRFGPGLLVYLNTMLYDNSNPIELDKDLCNFVIKIYATNLPSDLSKLIMKSYLPQIYSFDLCVKLISKYKRKQEAEEASLEPMDYVCFAYLHMKLGNPGHAEELLKEVKEEELVNLIISNVEVLINKQNQLTPMGQLLKKYFKRTFQSILVSLYDSGDISLENILSFFKQQDDQGGLKYSYQACVVLETLLNDSSRRKHFHNIVVLLIDQYLMRLYQKKMTEGWKLKHDHEVKGSGYFSARLSWLNSMHPFSGENPGPQDCVIATKTNHRNREESRKTNENEIAASLPNNQLEKPSSRNIFSTSSQDKNEASKYYKKREYCPCCCCSEILVKFQSLLCSKYTRKELCLHVIDKLKSYSFVGKESLLLLCWPKAGSPDKAIEYIVCNYPASILSYAKDMFDWKAEWQQLLQYILNLLKMNNGNGWNHDLYMDALRGVLLRLARALTPKEFLDVLPPDTSVNFILPYLRECCEFNDSSTLKKQILTTYKAEVIQTTAASASEDDSEC